MLNQLISDKNKNHKKRTRVEDTCDTLINGFDKEISSYKKQYLPYSKTNTLEKPQILSKTQKIINEIKSKKIKSSVYMSTHDIKSSKRIQNLFKKDKFKKPQIIQV